ncbi:MAG: response regulator [Lachnospiraceae bacterium]|nr:response regulator [Lachnospiraceae bacterium]
MYKLIIADDEALIRAGLFYCNDWNAMGFEVSAMLEDGNDVLEYLEKGRADVLLTDIRMYKVSGLEVANIIKEKYPWMKVVLLSGYKEFEYAREAMHCGVYEYLLKPVDYEQLTKLFEKIKEELDAVQHEEQLLHSIGEEEYGQILELTRLVAGAVFGEGEETWLAYAKFKPMIQNMPNKVRGIVIKRLLDLLQSKLYLKDETLAAEFEQQLKQLEFTAEAEDSSGTQLTDFLSRLNDELVTRRLIGTRSKGVDESISVACSWIRNHLGEDFTLQDVADFVHISPRHFRRRFESEMEEAFSDYVLRLRMEAAMKLLEEGNLVPEDIGPMVGYQSEKYFHRLFKKYVGCTAREYQHKKREGIK